MKLALHILETTLYASVWIAALFIGLVSLVLTGCGTTAHATPAKIDVPTIIIHEPAPPLAEEAPERDVTPPAVRLVDTITPPKAAVRIDANTYRACTCGDNCTCANCPDDCNLVARGDCPGGVCLLPMAASGGVSRRPAASETASGDCSNGTGVRGKIRAVGGKAWNGLKGAGRVIVRRFRR